MNGGCASSPSGAFPIWGSWKPEGKPPPCWPASGRARTWHRRTRSNRRCSRTSPPATASGARIAGNRPRSKPMTSTCATASCLPSAGLGMVRHYQRGQARRCQPRVRDCARHTAHGPAMGRAWRKRARRQRQYRHEPPAAVIARAMGSRAEPPPLPDEADGAGDGGEPDWTEGGDKRSIPLDPWDISPDEERENSGPSCDQPRQETAKRNILDSDNLNWI